MLLDVRLLRGVRLGLLVAEFGHGFFLGEAGGRPVVELAGHVVIRAGGMALAARGRGDAPEFEEAKALVVVGVLEEVYLGGEEERGVDAVAEEDSGEVRTVDVGFERWLRYATGWGNMVGVGIVC